MPRPAVFATFAVMLFSLSTAFSAESIHWRTLNEPGCDGWVVSLGVSPRTSQLVLVGGDLLGVGRSVNRGESWRPTFGFKSVEMGDFAFHPRNPLIVWAGTMSGPYVSRDGGRTWQQRREGFPPVATWHYSAPVEKILFDPNDDSRLLAFGGNSRRYMAQPHSRFGAVWQSTDAGNSWAEISFIDAAEGTFIEGKTPRGANLVGATFAAGSSKTLYVAAELRGVMRSDDGGKTWHERNAGLPHKNVERVVAHPTQPGTFWVCLNAWKPDGATEALSGSIFRSDDGGATYTELADGLPNRNHANPLFAANYKAFDVSRTNPDVMYVSDAAWNGCKVFRSLDGGQSWQCVLDKNAKAGSGVATVETAYPVGAAMTVLAIDPSDENTVFAAGAEYVVRTTDGGKTWTDVTSRRAGTGWAGRGYSGLCAMNFRYDPHREGHAILLAMDAGKCWETRDGLKSWNYHGQKPNPWGGGNDATFAKDGRVYTTAGQFGSHAAILRSEPGTEGKDAPWTPLFGDARGLPPNENAGVATGIYTLPDDSAKVWAVVGGRLYFSGDSGENWRKLSGAAAGLPDGECGWLAGDPKTPNRLYVSMKDAVRVTEDGATFKNIGGPRVPGRMTVDTHGRLYLAAYRGERPGLWRYNPSAGNAQAWTRLKDDHHLSNVAVDPQNADRVMVCANDDPYHDHVYSTGVSVSADGGKTWSDRNAGLPVTRGHAVAFNPFKPGEIIFGTLGCGFFRADWPTDFAPTGDISYTHTDADTQFAAAKKPAVNLLGNGSMSVKDSDDTKDGVKDWAETWGEVNATRDTTVFMRGPASLRVEPKTKNAAGQAFQILDGRAGQKLRLLGYVKSHGNARVNVAVQAFDADWKQNAFIQAKYLQGTIDWTHFDHEFTLPGWTARFNIQLMVEGDGRAWLDEAVLIPAGETWDGHADDARAEGVDAAMDVPPPAPVVEIPEAAVYKNPWTPTEGFFPDYPHAWKQFHESFLARAKEGKIDIAFFGDSITQGWDAKRWEKHFAPLGAVNFGIGGDRTQQVLWRMQNGELDGYKAKAVVVAIGINNTWDPVPGSTPEEVAKGVAAIIKTVKEKQPGAKIILVGVLPTGEKPDNPLRERVKEINRHYAKLADGESVRFLDFGHKLLQPDGTLSAETAPDFLHLSPTGYAIYAENLLPVLKPR